MTPKRKAATTFAVLASASVALVTAQTASAYTTVRSFGMQQNLNDAAGTIVTGWTVTDLKPSGDPVPFPVAGQLWEATAMATAVQGTATPIVSDFNARAHNGQSYRALYTVPAPEAVNPSPLGQGQTTTGSVYFDVVGAEPESVVYNNGVQDLLIWT